MSDLNLHQGYEIKEKRSRDLIIDIPIGNDSFLSPEPSKRINVTPNSR